MRIDTSKIRYEDFAAWADWDVQRQVAEACGVGDLGDLWQLRIKDLGKMVANNIPDSLHEAFTYESKRKKWWNRRRKISVKTYFERYNTLKAFMEVFLQTLQDFTMKETPESRQAARGLPSFNETEGLLVFVRDYFGLKSFTEAEEMTLADVYLAKKDSYIKASFERNYNELLTKKAKLKKI